MDRKDAVSPRLKALVAGLALLAIPSAAWAACSDYGNSSYDDCHNGSVIDPNTTVAYHCNDSADCIACTLQQCKATTFWCRDTCTKTAAAHCTQNNGCETARGLVRAGDDDAPPGEGIGG